MQWTNSLPVTDLLHLLSNLIPPIGDKEDGPLHHFTLIHKNQKYNHHTIKPLSDAHAFIYKYGDDNS